MSEEIKVLIAIPNMGYTQVEAYGNRLMNFMQMGNTQTERQLAALIRAHAPEQAEKILSSYQEKTNRTVGDEVFQFYFVNIGRMFTPAAREQAAKKAIEHGMDFLYFIDDDMIAPDDTFFRLFESLKRSGASVICPLAFTRNAPYKPVLYASIDGWDPVNKTDYFINNTVMNYPKNKLVEADACGFGAALIDVKIFNRIEPPYFMCSEGTGEDILFCYKVKKAYGRVFMDTSLKLGHLGHPQIITEEFAENFRKQHDPDAEKRYPEFTKYKALTLLGD